MSENATKMNYSRDPIRHMMGIEVCTFVNIFCSPRREQGDGSMESKMISTIFQSQTIEGCCSAIITT
jgi:hypothetical protein